MNKSTLPRIRPVFAATAVAAMMRLAQPAAAQDLSFGADFVSRYVWRGTDYGEAASIQPALSYSKNGFGVGTWASYALSPEAAGVDEHDLWLSYTHETAGRGSLGFGVTDYYFPSPGGPGFFEFKGGGNGAHWFEPFVTYTAPGPVPVSLFGGIFAYNDPDHSAYFEAKIPIHADGVDLGVSVGGVAGASNLYGTTGATIVNVGISASKSIPLTERFSLPIYVNYILNPDAQRSFLVFGISI